MEDSSKKFCEGFVIEISFGIYFCIKMIFLHFIIGYNSEVFKYFQMKRETPHGIPGFFFENSQQKFD